tara:strand:- start:537 stop:761 length:225 start_codon:yes stop_codon:yes gene_type:complete
MNKLKAINTVQFSFQLATALLLLYFTIYSGTPDRIIIPILLLLGWSLVFYQRRVTRRRINMLRGSKNKDILLKG